MDEDGKLKAKIRIMIRALDTQDDDELNAASEGLVDIGKPAVPQLIHALQNANTEIKYGVVSVLGLIKDESAVPALIDAMWNCDSDITRSDAAKALGWIGHPSAIPALKKALEHGELRRIAMDALSEIKDPALEEFFIKKLENGDWYEGWKSAEGLGKIGGFSAVEILFSALSAKQDAVRNAAKDALVEISKRLDLSDLKNLEAMLDGQMETLLAVKDKHPAMFVAKLRTAIATRKNELTPQRDILLDDIPKPPKKGGMYQRIRRTVRNG